MTTPKTAALLLIGSPGSGKSSVLTELRALLEADKTAHGAIESEVLAQGWPRPTCTEWLPQLEAVVTLQRQAGRHLLLVAATPETQADLDGLIRAAASDHVKVACLTAPPDVAANRVSEREPDSWPGKPWLIEQARRLADAIPSFKGIDARITTDGRVANHVATELYGLIRELFVLQ